jgi:hypothetical protein
MQYIQQYVDTEAAATSSNRGVSKISANDTGILGYGPPEPYFTLSGSNHIEIANNGSLQLSKFTLAAWFRTNMNIPFDKSMFIVNKGELGTEQPGHNINYGLWMDSSERIEAGFESSEATDYIVRGLTPYSDYQWHHAVSTYDGNALRLYIDGLPVKSILTDGAMPDNNGTDPLRIGAENLVVETVPRKGFIGLVDEIRVWNRALTYEEIVEGYTKGVYNEAGQVHYMPFG